MSRYLVIALLVWLALPAAAQAASSNVSITILPPKHPLAAKPAPTHRGPDRRQPVPHPRFEPADYTGLNKALSASISMLVLVNIFMLTLILFERGRQAFAAIRAAAGQRHPTRAGSTAA